jgi:hypothetical protein
MSVAFQCWEIGGGRHGGGGYKMGQRHQYVCDASSTYRWLQQAAHESSAVGRSALSPFSLQSQADAIKACNLPHHNRGVTVRLDNASSNSHICDSHNMSLDVEASTLTAKQTVSIVCLSDQPTLGSSLTILPSADQPDAEGSMEPKEALSRSGSIARLLDSGRIPNAITIVRLDTPPYNSSSSLVLHETDRVLRKIKHPAQESPSFVYDTLPKAEPILPTKEEIADENSSLLSSSIEDGADQDSSCSSDAETQSSGPLDQMTCLESSLPIRKPGLSKFFGGKSRSFSSLADVQSISDLAKPDNPYGRRRKMGFNCHLSRHRSYPPLSRSSVTGISKKSVNGSRSTLVVAVKLGGIDEDDEDNASPHQRSSRSSLNRSLPPRSFSLTDLPEAGTLGRTFGRC